MQTYVASEPASLISVFNSKISLSLVQLDIEML